MDDFTIEMRNLPLDYQFGYDDTALKACLYKHFETIVRRENGEQPNFVDIAPQKEEVVATTPSKSDQPAVVNALALQSSKENESGSG